jgi:hypothetical protein
MKLPSGLPSQIQYSHSLDSPQTGSTAPQRRPRCIPDVARAAPAHPAPAQHSTGLGPVNTAHLHRPHHPQQLAVLLEPPSQHPLLPPINALPPKTPAPSNNPPNARGVALPAAPLLLRGVQVAAVDGVHVGGAGCLPAAAQQALAVGLQRGGAAEPPQGAAAHLRGARVGWW